MALKKKTKKKVKAVKPFKVDEIVKFPCGASVTIQSWGSGGVILDLRLHSEGKQIRFCISDAALKMLPMLSKRGLATVKMAQELEK